MAIDPKLTAREGCIQHADGSISDAGFHDIEDEPPMSRAEVMRLRERALAQGMTHAELDEYFPLSGEPD